MEVVLIKNGLYFSLSNVSAVFKALEYIFKHLSWCLVAAASFVFIQLVA